MRTTIAVVLGAISLTSAFVFADKPDVAKSANDEVSTLFFGHDDRVPVNDTTQSPWDAVGQLETASGNLCTATLIAPNLALTAGHCLLTPPKGKADKAVALRFVSNKGLWRYEIHDIEGRVDPTLGKAVKSRWGWLDCSSRSCTMGLRRLCCVIPLLALHRCRYLREIKPRLLPH